VARHQKKAQKEGRAIVLIDESGFMLQPVVRRTWALRGQTPVHKSWDRHDRISAISAITCSPVRMKLSLYFRLQMANFRWPAVVSFVRELRRHVGPKLAIIWDRLNVHRSARVKLERLFGDQIEFYWLPGYAPELNPVEQVWSHTKFAELANNLPIDIAALWQDVYWSLSDKRRSPTLLKAFFHHAGLAL
jgi:transposase